MPPTLSNLHASLVGTLGGKLAFVGKSTAVDGTNPDLAGPVALALATLNCPPDDFGSPASPDVARVPARRVPDLYGLAQLFTLRAIWGCLTDVTETQVDRTQEWSAMSAEVAGRIRELEALYRATLKTYGTLSAGTIRIPSAARGPTSEL